MALPVLLVPALVAISLVLAKARNTPAGEGKPIDESGKKEGK